MLLLCMHLCTESQRHAACRMASVLCQPGYTEYTDGNCQQANSLMIEKELLLRVTTA